MTARDAVAVALSTRNRWNRLSAIAGLSVHEEAIVEGRVPTTEQALSESEAMDHLNLNLDFGE